MDSDTENLWYLRRLEGGLFTLQTVDYILAWIIMEDDGVSAGLTDHRFSFLTRYVDSCTYSTNATAERQVVQRDCQEFTGIPRQRG